MFRPASTSVIDPNGTWEAEFKYTAKWVMNLSEYDFNRVWIGLTMSSLVLTPDDYAADSPEPVVTKTELLSASVSFGSTLETFGTNLESSINANTINSGWEVYGWTISKEKIFPTKWFASSIILQKSKLSGKLKPNLKKLLFNHEN